MSSIFHFAVRLALLCSKIVLSGYLEVQDEVRYMTLRVGNSGELEVSRLANNPFLILGVSATAEMGVIQKVGKEVAMRARLGGGDEAKVHRVESAIEQLKDPVKRFRWGVLWLQMSDDDSAKYRADPVLSSFAMDATQDAATAFEKLIHDQPPELANHNIGLLSLIQAEAATEKAQGDTPDDVEDDIECVPLWERAFKHLAESFASEKFWMRQRMFAKTLADPRLTTDVVTRVQEDTARLVLRLPSKVIQTALLRQHAGVASAFVGVINESGFNKDTVESLLSEIYKPLADRVEHNVEKLSGRLQSQSGKSRSPYEKILADFKREVLPDLRVMLKVGDLPGYAEEHARDTSAQFLRLCAIRAWNEAEAIDLSEDALAIAKEVVDSDALTTKLAKDEADFAELREVHKQVAIRNSCAFCGASSTAKGDAYDLAMHKVTGSSGNSVKYTRATIPIPRCHGCRNHHDKANFASVVVGLLVWLAIIIGVFAGTGGRNGWPIIGQLAAAGIGGLIAMGLSLAIVQFLINLFGPSATWKARRHPAAKALRVEGYRFGEKPS